MRVTRILVGLLVACVIVSCATPDKPRPHPHKIIPSLRVSERRHVRDFSKITVIGEINTDLRPVKRGHGVTLRGDKRDLKHVKTLVDNDRLYVVVDKYYPLHQPLKATISVVQLNGLQFKGYGDIKGHGLYTSSMDISLDAIGSLNLSGKIGLRRLETRNENVVTIKGISSDYLEVIMANGFRVDNGPDVRLEGFSNLREVKYSGNGNLSLFWIDSPKLLVNGYGQASIHLAGIVNLLNVNLYNYAELDGQYLRVNKAYIKTSDNSLARLQPVKQLNALAVDKSNIYYYSEPKFEAAFMDQNGSVLNFKPFWF